MSVVKSNALQIGQSATATNNFTFYQPASPDGTVRLGVGNAGATTSDVITVSSAGLSSLALIPSGSSAPTNGLYLPAANTLGWSTNSSEKLRLDSAGNLGLGVTPSAWGYTALQIKSGAVYEHASTDFRVIQNAYYAAGNAPKYINTAAASMYRQDAGTHYWYNAPSGTAGNAITFTQAMTLDASGNLLVGDTSATPGNAKIQSTFNGAAINGIDVRTTYTGGTSYLLSFFNNARSSVGTISTNGSTTAFNTSSDYRLKENIQPMTGALVKVASLKPCTYKWKENGLDGEGFIAHELQEVVPQVVCGEKDGEQMQGVDYGKLTPLLTAAIQELSAQVTTLQAEINALKA
jgi:hypothetical protein